MFAENPYGNPYRAEQYREQLKRLAAQPPVLERVSRWLWRAASYMLGAGLVRVGSLLVRQGQPSRERTAPANALPLVSLRND